MAPLPADCFAFAFTLAGSQHNLRTRLERQLGQSFRLGERTKSFHEVIGAGRILVPVDEILRYISMLAMKAAQGLQKLRVAPADAENIFVTAAVFPASPPVPLYLAMGWCGQSCFTQRIRERAETKPDMPRTRQIRAALDKAGFGPKPDVQGERPTPFSERTASSSSGARRGVA